MLLTTACWKELPTTRRPRACIFQGEIGCSLFLVDLVLPERYGTATYLQYRRRIQARQHGLDGGKLSTARRPPPTLNMYAHTCSAHRLVVVRGMQRRNLTQSTRARCFLDGFKRKGRCSSLTTTSSLFDPRTHMAFYCWLSGKKQFFEATYGSTRDVSQASRAGLGISGCDPRIVTAPGQSRDAPNSSFAHSTGTSGRCTCQKAYLPSPDIVIMTRTAEYM
jgi:hypothetical protein